MRSLLVELAVCSLLAVGGCTNAPSAAQALQVVEQGYLTAVNLETSLVANKVVSPSDALTMKDLDNKVYFALSTAQGAVKANDPKSTQLVNLALSSLGDLTTFLSKAKGSTP